MSWLFDFQEQSYSTFLFHGMICRTSWALTPARGIQFSLRSKLRQNYISTCTRGRFMNLSSERAMLLSIKPHFAQAILDGSKTIELRRQEPKIPPGTLVVMYASQPTSALVGTFVLEEIVRLSVTGFWKKFGHRTGIDKGVYETYYLGRENAIGLSIGASWKLHQEVPLKKMRGIWQNFHPPQSYRYLKPSMEEPAIGLKFGSQTARFGL
jgi:predicted transcriptional regulator